MHNFHRSYSVMQEPAFNFSRHLKCVYVATIDLPMVLLFSLQSLWCRLLAPTNYVNAQIH